MIRIPGAAALSFFPALNASIDVLTNTYIYMCVYETIKLDISNYFRNITKGRSFRFFPGEIKNFYLRLRWMDLSLDFEFLIGPCLYESLIYLF